MVPKCPYLINLNLKKIFIDANNWPQTLPKKLFFAKLKKNLSFKLG